MYNAISFFNTVNAKLNPICHLLALLGAHHILHVSRISVKDHTCKYVFMYNALFSSDFNNSTKNRFHFFNVKFQRNKSIEICALLGFLRSVER